MERFSFKRALVPFILAVSLILPAYASVQSKGSIRGHVIDDNGFPVSQVKITLYSDGRRLTSTVTDENGDYQFSDLPVGTYLLTFERMNFQKSRKSNQKVNQDQSTEVSVTLKTGSGVPTGIISGVVTDPSGGGVNRATVTMINKETGFTRTVNTSEDGSFQAQVPMGDYDVQTEARGFKILINSNVPVDPDQTLALNLPLQSGVGTETVAVTAESDQLGTEQVGKLETLESRQIEELPLMNRRYADLVQLFSRASKVDNADMLNAPGISLSGVRVGSTNFILDNADDSSNLATGPATGRQLPLGTIQELSLTPFYEPAFGHYAGDLVGIVLRGGGNDPHGSLHYFHSNSSLSARDFFEQDKGPFHLNDFGFTLGGAVVRDRTFLFGGYEGKRDFDARPRLISVPSPSRLAAARFVLTAAGLQENHLSDRLLRFFPPPDLPGLFNNRFNDSPAINDADALLIRFTQQINGRGMLTARYDLNRTDALFPQSFSVLPGFRTDASARRDSFLLSDVRDLSSHSTNEAGFAFHRDRAIFLPEDRHLDPASLGLNTGVTDPERFGLPLIKITGFDALGAPFAIPSRAVGRTWQARDTFAIVINNHSVRVGGDFRRVAIDSRDDAGTRGRIVFDGSALGDPLADFLAGLASGNTAIVRGDTRRGTALNSIAVFANDAYRLRPTLTLNFGLRYELNGVIHESEDRLSNFLLPTAGLVQVGLPALGELYKKDVNNVAPRLAITWDPTGSARMVVRANWGIFYDNPQPYLFIGLGPFTNAALTGATANPVGPNPIFSLHPSVPTRIGNGMAIFDPASPDARSDFFAVQQNLQTPYLQRFSLGISRLFLLDYVFTVAYEGLVGSHLYRTVDLNQPTPGEPNAEDSRRPFAALFPQARSINLLTSAGKSNYQALNASLERRLSHGLIFYAGYTFSKAIDDASTANELPQNSRDLRSERAVADFDRRHRFMLRGLYQLPESTRAILVGWQVAGIFKAASGAPFTPTISFDHSGTGTFADRPALIGDPRAHMDDPTRPYTASAYRIPPGRFGNAGRNSLLGPGFNSLDLSVRKRTMLPHDSSIDLRLDIFNLFNRPNFQVPNRFVDDPAFGTVSATDPFNGRRLMRVGVQIRF